MGDVSPFPTLRLPGGGTRSACPCLSTGMDYFIKMDFVTLHPHWMQWGLSSAERTWISFL